MKRIIKVLLFTALLTLMTVIACGEGTDFIEDAQDFLSGDISEELGSLIPESAKEILEEQGVDSIADVGGITPQKIWDTLKSYFIKELTSPLKLLVSIVGITLITALTQALGESLGKSSTWEIFHVVAGVFVTGAVITPIVECIFETVEVIREFSYFILSFIPAFAGVVASAGQPVTSAAYNLFLFWMCQISSQLITDILVPLICGYLALSVISVICPRMSLGRLTSAIKSFVIWALGLMLTVFIGLLTVQSAISSSGDAAAAKTAKFVVGSLIPVAGGALADMLIAAQGCIQIVKGAVGAFGVAVTLFTFLPVLLKLAGWYIAISLSAAAGELFGTDKLGTLLRAVGGAIGIMIAIVIYYALTVVISTTLLIVVFKGA